MTALIRHFGDTADAHKPCGHCDFCAPNSATAQTFSEPTTEQARNLRSILRALESRSTSTGKLHTDLALGIDRKQFDILLDALARAGLITLTTDTFTSKDDGRIIAYKKAALTHEGRSEDASELSGVVLPAASEFESTPTSSRKRKSGSRTSGTNPRSTRSSTEDIPANLNAEQKTLETNLRAWRKAEAAKTGKPAFIVLSDAVIRNIAIANPQSISELLTVSGIGQNKADQFGANIIALCHSADPNEGNLFISNSSSTAPHTNRQSPTPARLQASEAASQGPKARHIPAQAAGPGVRPVKSQSAEGATHNLTAPAEFHRTRPEASDPTAALTPDQQLLDAQLRAWRKAESERIGLPQFFVLGASALRSIVLTRPKTLAQLQTITGIGADKADQFGASILEICSMESTTQEGSHAS